MSEDEGWKHRPKKFRRKKKHEGQNWDQSDVLRELESAKRKGRQHCKPCHKFQPWSRLEPKLERVGKGLYQMVWYCMDCGNAVFVQDYDVRKKKKKKVANTP